MLLKALSATLEAMCGQPGAQPVAQPAGDTPVSPSPLHHVLPPPFSETTQQDAEELLVRVLLDALLAPGSYAGDVFRSLFVGQISFQTTCSLCGYTSPSAQTEDVSVLHLPVSGPTLDECVGGAFADEVLEGDNAYACPTCQDHVRATRTTALAHASDHVFLSLNRFTQSSDKIVTPVDFSESLVLCNSRYVLRAVIVHKGLSADSGHYTAFVNAGRVGEASSWFQANDQVVTPLGPSFPDLFSVGVQGGGSTPYVLVYSRDTRLDGQQDGLSGGARRIWLRRMERRMEGRNLNLGLRDEGGCVRLISVWRRKREGGGRGGRGGRGKGWGRRREATANQPEK